MQRITVLLYNLLLSSDTQRNSVPSDLAFQLEGTRGDTSKRLPRSIPKMRPIDTYCFHNFLTSTGAGFFVGPHQEKSQLYVLQFYDGPLIESLLQV